MTDFSAAALIELQKRFESRSIDRLIDVRVFAELAETYAFHFARFATLAMLYEQAKARSESCIPQQSPEAALDTPDPALYAMPPQVVPWVWSAAFTSATNVSIGNRSFIVQFELNHRTAAYTLDITPVPHQRARRAPQSFPLRAECPARSLVVNDPWGRLGGKGGQVAELLDLAHSWIVGRVARYSAALSSQLIESMYQIVRTRVGEAAARHIYLFMVTGSHGVYVLDATAQASLREALGREAVLGQSAAMAMAGIMAIRFDPNITETKRTVFPAGRAVDFAFNELLPADPRAFDAQTALVNGRRMTIQPLAGNQHSSMLAATYSPRYRGAVHDSLVRARPDLEKEFLRHRAAIEERLVHHFSEDPSSRSLQAGAAWPDDAQSRLHRRLRSRDETPAAGREERAATRMVPTSSQADVAKSDGSAEHRGCEGPEGESSETPKGKRAHATEPRVSGLVVCDETLTVRYADLPVIQMKNTVGFRVLQCLASARLGVWVTHEELMQHAWGGDEKSEETIYAEISRLRTRLRAAFGERVSIISTTGRYRLELT